MRKRVAELYLLCMAVFCCLQGCGQEKPWTQEKETITEMPAEMTTEMPEEIQTEETHEEDVISEKTEPESVPAFEEWDITLMAVGDNLMHMGVVKTGQMSDGTYDYSCLFEGISDYLQVADIKIINQETIMGGNHLGFSGFPYFNSPTQVGEAIADAGFNVVLQASNHSADQEIAGLKHCAAFWENYPEVLMAGIYEEVPEENNIPIITIEGIDFAILNYTYGPNLEVVPQDIRGHLEILCDWDENTGKIDFTTLSEKVVEDIEMAEQIADVVVVCPHWGREYQTEPSSYQQEFALQMAQAGADVIIGTHPHVVQPVEWIESENGNRALCYYSLGNYVSTQKEGLCMLEGMAWITFRVKEDGVIIQEEKTGVIPMVCHYTSGPVRIEKVYMLEEYTSEQAAEHGIHSYGGVNLTLEDLQNWSEEILGEWILEPK